MPDSPTQHERDTMPETARYALATTAYDRAASLLIALLILVVTATALAFAIWLTARIFSRPVAVPVELQQIGEGGGFGDSAELDPDIQDPGIETEFDEPELAQTLATIDDVLATKTATFDDPTLWDASTTGRHGPRGEGRTPGNGAGRPGVPRRWEVEFVDGNTLQTYAEQLDFFGIELGVLQPGGKVAYAYQLAKPTPGKRVGLAEDEKRYYLTWQNGSLEEGDRELLKRAGISVDDRPILKFLPPELEARLAGMEQQRAGVKKDKVRATYFGVRRVGDGYEFYIIDQLLGN